MNSCQEMLLDLIFSSRLAKASQKKETTELLYTREKLIPNTVLKSKVLELFSQKSIRNIQLYHFQSDHLKILLLLRLE